MNILTFDIEEWYLEKHSKAERKSRYIEYDEYLERILECLDIQGLKATFFCVGGMAREFPEVVRKIAERGHEIGCHSDVHTWLNKMSPDECRIDTKTAVDSLEQCVGEKVKSFRAPAFSINDANSWAFDILVECGIERDASVFPAERDFGGFARFGKKSPCIVRHDGISIKEFPICTAKVLGKEMAYSGGGYFRFFPLGYVRREIAHSEYSMTYFHIEDLLPETNGVMSRKDYEEYFKEPGTIMARYKRYVKSNLGKKGSWSKLTELISSVDFMNMCQADESLDWANAPVVSL